MPVFRLCGLIAALVIFSTVLLTPPAVAADGDKAVLITGASTGIG